ncbi:MAG: translation elongation factor Ts [Pseudomonadota bacterium]|nr:translation elongation factor Ts [Pseudomonadota bacterium]
MTVTASLVKEMRDRTGLGMMECKRALVESGGDIEAAIENMRKSGQAQADKKAGRVAADGVVAVASAPDNKAHLLVEVNCETDFVAKDENFVAFADLVAATALAAGQTDIDALGGLAIAGEGTIEQARQALISKVGENVQIRRLALCEDPDSQFAVYQHGVRIGVVVQYRGGEEQLGRDLAMHIAASRPVCVQESDLSPELIAKEREIYAAQAADSGKPDDIQQKMVDGRIRKFVGEVTLLGQPFVKDPDTKVEKLLRAAGAQVIRFVRLEVGEGIEKQESDFVAEVMEQAKS